MPKKSKPSSRKKGSLKRARTSKRGSLKSSASSRKRAVNAFEVGRKSATRGRTALVVVQGGTGKYRLYGSKSGALRRQIVGKSSATQILRGLGIKPEVVREVDAVIANLRLRKKIS